MSGPALPCPAPPVLGLQSCPVNDLPPGAVVLQITNRFTINLPGGQKAVMRISPQLTLEQVFARVCQDKSLDSRRYTLQHPTNPLTPLNLKATIADSKLSEINLIHTGGQFPLSVFICVCVCVGV